MQLCRKQCALRLVHRWRRTAQQRKVQRSLEKWRASQSAAQSIGRNMPAGVADAQRYAAASSLYRLGQMQDVGSFEQAMEIARGRCSYGNQAGWTGDLL